MKNDESNAPKRGSASTKVMAKTKAPSVSLTATRPPVAVELDCIHVVGAKEHNLKNIEVKIPKKKLVVITGVSGSGKSSLAFDTLYAEGQRRYVESLSAYARQFLGQMEKPSFETIKGLSPTIAIEQKAASKNPRSTVGTITEIYDYLRVLYARVGTQYCIHCGKVVGKGDAETMVKSILAMPPSTKIMILAPIIDNRKGEHREVLENLKRKGFQRLRIDGVMCEWDDVQTLSKNKKHNIEVVVDRLVIKSDDSFVKRLTDTVETSLSMGQGNIIVHVVGREDIVLSENRSCCGEAYRELEPTHFSFNSPLGMCPNCHGLGELLCMDENLIVPDQSVSIREGAIVPWANYFEESGSMKGHWGAERVQAIAKQWGVNLDTPWKKLSAQHRQWIMNGPPEGSGKELKLKWHGEKSSGTWTTQHEGLVNSLMRRYQQSTSDKAKSWYEKFMSAKSCELCHGLRLKKDILHVKICEKSIAELTMLNISAAMCFLEELKLDPHQLTIATELCKEIKSRLYFLLNVGLGYLSLDRKGPTLSGGEAQRIRLASQIGSELTGVLYVLDEPSIGLHQRDNQKLLNMLFHLRDIGNSLLVVEHDHETIEAADWVLDIGPGAGLLGGQVVAEGTPAEIRANKNSLTGLYLSGAMAITVPEERRIPFEQDGWLTIFGATENNLKNIDVAIPIGLFTSITGVSGAGKSTLVNQILYPALCRELNGTQVGVGAHKKIVGIDLVDKIVAIDQRPIGRTPRSNPATYTKLFDHIRDLFALIPEAKARGYQKGRFSFNVKGGRCENCEGDGHIKVEMHFLADVYVPCEVCRGKRFNSATLEVKYRGHSIADVLDMSVRQAVELFSNHPALHKILETLMAVGLDYIKLGQAATTLSGGEAQRVKLSKELAKRDTGRTFYILDEPTTGLHFEDIRKLLIVLQGLVDAGNTVVVIEHNLDVIKSSDWVIDIGPEGGEAGGQLIAAGSPENVAKVEESFTGQFLAGVL
jgi:excinuclease ABC subunit A